MSEVTRILSQIESGDPAAADKLLPLVYDELRKLAAAKMAHEKPDQTLQATALVHEAYLRLVGNPGNRGQETGDREQETENGEANLSPVSCPLSPASFNSRGHFFGAAAEAMRRILIENARGKAREKRGGDWQRVDFEDLDLATSASPEQLVALDDALERLAELDPLAGQLVKLHYFAGLPLDQAAAAQGVSTATAYRHWAYARAWLHTELVEES
jgi:RNA polymerase sigma factor (sigma-70 family)